MPLANDVIIRLNEITALVRDGGGIGDAEVARIKGIFGEILDAGLDYNVDEVESWLANEGSWKDGAARARVTNLSHYVQSRREQASRLKVMRDDGQCGCD